jgi:hypothetical protein
LLRQLALANGNLDILIIIPKQRDCREDFLRLMRDEGGFTWTTETLDGPSYRFRVLQTEKESGKYYPGIEKLDFELYSFKLSV